MNIIKRYNQEMVSRKRVITIESNQLECIIFFFVIHSLEGFINRPMWSCPEDTEDGHILFVDKMICRKWTVGLRKAFEETILEKYPQLTEAHWLREPNNRHVIIKRGERYVHC